MAKQRPVQAWEVRIKSFEKGTAESVEEEMNFWLEKNPNVRIRRIKYGARSSHIYAFVEYELFSSETPIVGSNSEG